MATYAEYKNRRADITSVVDKLSQTNSAVKKTAKDYEDSRMYKYTLDDAGNSSQIIRFLPNKNPDIAPIILRYKHFFNNNGTYFVENCPTTLGRSCCVCDNNKYLYSLGAEGELQAKGKTRTKDYFANILVVNDPKNPSNNGTVKLFKFGQQIYDIIMNAAKPEFGEPRDIFDPDNGFNFILRTYKKKGYIQYDKSVFDMSPSAIDPTIVNKVFESLYDISEFRDPSSFLPEAEYKAKFDRVMGMQVKASTMESSPSAQFESMATQAQASTSTPKETVSYESAISTDDIDSLFE